MFHAPGVCLDSKGFFKSGFKHSHDYSVRKGDQNVPRTEKLKTSRCNNSKRRRLRSAAIMTNTYMPHTLASGPLTNTFPHSLSLTPHPHRLRWCFEYFCAHPRQLGGGGEKVDLARSLECSQINYGSGNHDRRINCSKHEKRSVFGNCFKRGRGCCSCSLYLFSPGFFYR